MNYVYFKWRVMQAGYSLDDEGLNGPENCPECGEIARWWDQWKHRDAIPEKDGYFQVWHCEACGFVDETVNYYDEDFYLRSCPVEEILHWRPFPLFEYDDDE